MAPSLRKRKSLLVLSPRQSSEYDLGVMGDGTPPIELRISEDAMTAEVKIASGAAVGLPAVLNALAGRGVVYGIDQKSIEEALEKRGEWVVVARGTPAVKPVHGRVEYHFSTSQKPKVTIRKNGSADFKELGYVQNVTAGFQLATLVDPVPGRTGRNLRGDVLPCAEPVPAKLKPGRNVSISEDGRHLIADVDGAVKIDRDGVVSVDQVLNILGDVGPETGNIDFVGTVIVGGNVLSDFRVKAAEEVVVRGSVEGAFIEGRKGVRIEGGVFGSGKALIQSPGNITVRRAQDAHLYSGGDILVQDSLVRVSAVAAGKISVARAIIGGSVAAPSVFAGTLGADSETRTVVEIGISPRARLMGRKWEMDFQKARNRLIIVRERLHPLQEAKRSGKIMDREMVVEMDRLEREEFSLLSTILAAAADVRIMLAKPDTAVPGTLTVSGTVHRGVILASCGMERPVTQEHPRLKVTASEGKLAGGAA
ncbi:MAG: DUF342 domain-containing protein [Candidatus Hydrogenedentota bacterium]|nr:MAG: DUF342 domain-containing protein [Candidatus Hydrogenedentota bacterium]